MDKKNNNVSLNPLDLETTLGTAMEVPPEEKEPEEGTEDTGS